MARPASAQIPPELKNDKISFAYVPPDSPKLQPIMERLKNRQLLEKLAAFLSPLQLPHAFYLVARECKEPNAFYNPSNWRIEICYEMIELIDKVAPSPSKPIDGFTREEVVVGAFVGVLIHEVGHAAFDMFNVPVFGREEDAADVMAAFLAVQFNKDVARTVTRGFAYLWRAFARWAASPRTGANSRTSTAPVSSATTTCCASAMATIRRRSRTSSTRAGCRRSGRKAVAPSTSRRGRPSSRRCCPSSTRA